MKRRRNLDYAVAGNLIIPLLLLESEQFLCLIEDAEAGRVQMVYCRKIKKK